MRVVKIFIEENVLVLQDLDKTEKQSPNSVKREYIGNLISFKDLAGNPLFNGDQFDMSHITDMNGQTYTEEDFAKLFFADAALDAAAALEVRVEVIEGDVSTLQGQVEALEQEEASEHSIWGYVDTYSQMPLGITATDPKIDDLVGVNTDTGVSVFGIGNKRYKGFYRRVALTGVVATDYGTSPFTGFPIQSTQALVDAGVDDTTFVTPLTLQNKPTTLDIETEKETPIDADSIGLLNSVNGNFITTTIAHFKALLKSYFDGFYSTITNLNSEVTNRTNADIVLQDQVDALQGSLFDGIAYNAAAPTPGKTCEVEFISGGVTGSWLGGITVQVGDRAIIKFTAPSTYEYKYVPVNISLVQSLNGNETGKAPSVRVVGDSLKLKTTSSVVLGGNLFDKNNTIGRTIDYHLNILNGTKIPASGYFVSAPISVVGISGIWLNYVPEVCFYNDNNMFISPLANDGFYVPVPVGATYLQFSTIFSQLVIDKIGIYAIKHGYSSATNDSDFSLYLNTINGDRLPYEISHYSNNKYSFNDIDLLSIYQKGGSIISGTLGSMCRVRLPIWYNAKQGLRFDFKFKLNFDGNIGATDYNLFEMIYQSTKSFNTKFKCAVPLTRLAFPDSKYKVNFTVGTYDVGRGTIVKPFLPSVFSIRQKAFTDADINKTVLVDDTGFYIKDGTTVLFTFLFSAGYTVRNLYDALLANSDFTTAYEIEFFDLENHFCADLAQGSIYLCRYIDYKEHTADALIQKLDGFPAFLNLSLKNTEHTITAIFKGITVNSTSVQKYRYEMFFDNTRIYSEDISSINLTNEYLGYIELGDSLGITPISFNITTKKNELSMPTSISYVTHYFSDTEDAPVAYTTSYGRLSEVISYAKSKGFVFPSMRDFVKYSTGELSAPQKSMYFFVDDGFADHITKEKVRNLLFRYGIKPPVAWIGDQLGVTDLTSLKKMLPMDWSIASHSYHHEHLQYYDYILLKSNTDLNNQSLMDNSTPTNVIVFPFGSTDYRVGRYLRYHGYLVGMLTDNAINFVGSWDADGNGLMAIKRANIQDLDTTFENIKSLIDSVDNF